MKLKLKKITGFTLAETLIVLVIIGVIAALTLSPLSASIQKRQFVTKLKKAYSLLRKVTTTMQQKNTSIESLSLDNFFEEFKSNLHYSKTCENLSDCFGDEYKKAGGNTVCNISSYLNESKCKSLKTHDGISYAVCYNSWWALYRFSIDRKYTPNNSSSDGFFPFYHIVVDLNGKLKPNVGGHDYFTFVYLPKHGIIPDGAGNASPDHGYCQGYAANTLKTDKLVDE